MRHTLELVVCLFGVGRVDYQKRFWTPWELTVTQQSLKERAQPRRAMSQVYTSIHLHIILHTAQCDASISFTISHIKLSSVLTSYMIDTEREAYDPGAGWVGVYRAVMCTPIRVSGTCAISSPTSCCDLYYLPFLHATASASLHGRRVRGEPDQIHLTCSKMVGLSGGATKGKPTSHAAHSATQGGGSAFAQGRAAARCTALAGHEATERRAHCIR